MPGARPPIAIGAGGVAAAALLVMLVGGGEADLGEPVEIAAPAQPLPHPAPAPRPEAVPPPSAEGLTLHGVLGGAAIIGFPDGAQRRVPLGRPVLPGLTLAEVEADHAVLAGPGGAVRLSFDRAGGTAIAAVPAAPSTAEARQRQETVDYRLSMRPVESGGYAIRPGASPPHLDRAGLRPGDIVTGVNGSALDGERLTELSWQIANSDRTEFEFIRDGRRMKAELKQR